MAVGSQMDFAQPHQVKHALEEAISERNVVGVQKLLWDFDQALPVLLAAGVREKALGTVASLKEVVVCALEMLDSPGTGDVGGVLKTELNNLITTTLACAPYACLGEGTTVRMENSDAGITQFQVPNVTDPYLAFLAVLQSTILPHPNVSSFGLLPLQIAAACTANLLARDAASALGFLATGVSYATHISIEIAVVRMCGGPLPLHALALCTAAAKSHPFSPYASARPLSSSRSLYAQTSESPISLEPFFGTNAISLSPTDLSLALTPLRSLRYQAPVDPSLLLRAAFLAPLESENLRVLLTRAIGHPVRQTIVLAARFALAAAVPEEYARPLHLFLPTLQLSNLTPIQSASVNVNLSNAIIQFLAHPPVSLDVTRCGAAFCHLAPPLPPPCVLSISAASWRVISLASTPPVTQGDRASQNLWWSWCRSDPALALHRAIISGWKMQLELGAAGTREIGGGATAVAWAACYLRRPEAIAAAIFKCAHIGNEAVEWCVGAMEEALARGVVTTSIAEEALALLISGASACETGMQAWWVDDQSSGISVPTADELLEAHRTFHIVALGRSTEIASPFPSVLHCLHSSHPLPPSPIKIDPLFPDTIRIYSHVLPPGAFARIVLDKVWEWSLGNPEYAKDAVKSVLGGRGEEALRNWRKTGGTAKWLYSKKGRRGVEEALAGLEALALDDMKRPEVDVASTPATQASAARLAAHLVLSARSVAKQWQDNFLLRMLDGDGKAMCFLTAMVAEEPATRGWVALAAARGGPPIWNQCIGVPKLADVLAWHFFSLSSHVDTEAARVILSWPDPSGSAVVNVLEWLVSRGDAPTPISQHAPDWFDRHFIDELVHALADPSNLAAPAVFAGLITSTGASAAKFFPSPNGLDRLASALSALPDAKRAKTLARFPSRFSRPVDIAKAALSHPVLAQAGRNAGWLAALSGKWPQTLKDALEASGEGADAVWQGAIAGAAQKFSKGKLSDVAEESLGWLRGFLKKLVDEREKSLREGWMGSEERTNGIEMDTRIEIRVDRGRGPGMASLTAPTGQGRGQSTAMPRSNKRQLQNAVENTKKRRRVEVEPPEKAIAALSKLRRSIKLDPTDEVEEKFTAPAVREMMGLILGVPASLRSLVRLTMIESGQFADEATAIVEALCDSEGLQGESRRLAVLRTLCASDHLEHPIQDDLGTDPYLDVLLPKALQLPKKSDIMREVSNLLDVAVIAVERAFRNEKPVRAWRVISVVVEQHRELAEVTTARLLGIVKNSLGSRLQNSVGVTEALTLVARIATTGILLSTGGAASVIAEVLEMDPMVAVEPAIQLVAAWWKEPQSRGRAPIMRCIAGLVHVMASDNEATAVLSVNLLKQMKQDDPTVSELVEKSLMALNREAWTIAHWRWLGVIGNDHRVGCGWDVPMVQPISKMQ
ncbi:hypothetical protein HDU93_000691 [Gonapodya sp. JEL0774]|nr:hypothetical protein HDU93_000691 [Gonapodya sp. JEL0774]